MSATVDLNNYTYTYTGSGSAFATNNSSYNRQGINLTFTNGSIVSQNGSGISILSDGSSITLDNVKLESKVFGISTNNSYAPNATITIKNSTIKSNSDSAIYFPSEGNLSIYNSTIEGCTGIEALGGTISVEKSTISATGDYAESGDLADGVYGSVNDGSAILLRSQTPYMTGKTLSLTIDDSSTLSSTNGKLLRVYESTKGAGVTTITVSMPTSINNVLYTLQDSSSVTLTVNGKTVTGQ